MTSMPGVAAPIQAATAAEEWVVFGCGAHRFGLSVGRVREITTPRPATRLPGCGPEVRGIVALRGRVVTVFDFGAAFGVGPVSGPPEDRRVLLVQHGERLVGLLVDRVEGVARGEGAVLALGAGALREVDVERPEVLGVGTYAESAFVAVDSDMIIGRMVA